MNAQNKKIFLVAGVVLLLCAVILFFVGDSNAVVALGLAAAGAGMIVVHSQITDDN